MENEASMGDELLNSIRIKIIRNSEKTDALEQFGWSEPRYPVMHRVPDVFRRQNEGVYEDVYNPITISLGPIHNGKKYLQATESIKVSYMHLLFDRTPSFRQTQEDCVTAMTVMEHDIRKCFREVELDDSVRLAEIILIDCCFLIELLYRNYRKEQDPILWNPFNCYAVHRDLLLLENQIPFFVLEKLFHLTVERIPEKMHQLSVPTLIECVRSFFGGMMGPDNGKTEYWYSRSPHHILHLLYFCFLPRISEEEWEKWEHSIKNKVAEFKFSAKQLDIVGVKLKQSVNSKHRFDLKFSISRRFCLWKRGQLEIPPFYIDESTEPFLRNLIAFEQCSPHLPNIITSYTSLMCILVNTNDDVELLEEAGIINNTLGSTKAVLHIFKDMRKNAVPRNFVYNQTWTEVKEFCTPSRVRSGKLMHIYFGKIWVRVSLVSGIVLFLLTFLQTFYSMFPYHHNPNQ
ncbi:UPF0481 protein At3g47200-like [Cornus florida]|uniref:UPF0481 protein At3g47200-like n=1 Tax=Cornus florida TaxID=4283 RepID=UPI0028A275F6|nr:UPF0481 protein At3g47200-like [Cornus florida]